MVEQLINLQYTTIKQPVPDFIYEEIRNYSAGANSYHPQPAELVERLAQLHGVSSNMVFLTAGIDEAIQLFALTYGSDAYVFTPTYVVYTDVKEFGGRLTRIPSIVDNEYSITTDTLKDASLIFLANPNNPSGFTPKEKVIELIENNQDAMVCIDEAYGEFAPELSVIDQLESYPNLAVFRSFSKDYGMAGNRVGYILSQPEVIEQVKPKAQWANLSYLSVGAALSALNHPAYFEKMRDEIHRRREDFLAFLDRSSFDYLVSRINAVLVSFDSEASGSAFVRHLNKYDIVISHGNGNSNIGLDKSFVRISIGTEEQMNKLKEVVRRYHDETA